jgi:hypothetical protein
MSVGKRAARRWARIEAVEQAIARFVESLPSATHVSYSALSELAVDTLDKFDAVWRNGAKERPSLTVNLTEEQLEKVLADERGPLEPPSLLPLPPRYTKFRHDPRIAVNFIAPPSPPSSGSSVFDFASIRKHLK